MPPRKPCRVPDRRKFQTATFSAFGACTTGCRSQGNCRLAPRAPARWTLHRSATSMPETGPDGRSPEPCGTSASPCSAPGTRDGPRPGPAAFPAAGGVPKAASCSAGRMPSSLPVPPTSCQLQRSRTRRRDGLARSSAWPGTRRASSSAQSIWGCRTAERGGRVAVPSIQTSRAAPLDAKPAARTGHVTEFNGKLAESIKTASAKDTARAGLGRYPPAAQHGGHKGPDRVRMPASGPFERADHVQGPCPSHALPYAHGSLGVGGRPGRGCPMPAFQVHGAGDRFANAVLRSGFDHISNWLRGG